MLIIFEVRIWEFGRDSDSFFRHFLMKMKHEYISISLENSFRDITFLQIFEQQALPLQYSFMIISPKKFAISDALK